MQRPRAALQSHLLRGAPSSSDSHKAAAQPTAAPRGPQTSLPSPHAHANTVPHHHHPPGNYSAFSPTVLWIFFSHNKTFLFISRVRQSTDRGHLKVKSEGENSSINLEKSWPRANCILFPPPLQQMCPLNYRKDISNDTVLAWKAMCF